MPRNARLALLFLVPLVLAGAPPARADADAWREKLSRGDPAEIYKTIEAAADAKAIDAGLPILEAAPRFEYPHLAIAAGEALKAMGFPGEDKKIVRDFKKWAKKALNAKDDAELMNIARVYAAWGDPAVDGELAHFASGRRSPELQAEALQLCAILPRPTEDAPWKEVREAVLDGIDGRTDDVKAAACSAAAVLGDETFFEDLVAMVKKDRGDYAGLYGVWALKRLGYAGGLKPFLHVLDSNPKKATRQANLKAITELATKADIPELLSMTRASKQDYRDAAALALGRMSWRGKYGGKVVTGEGQHDSQLPAVPQEIIDRFIQMIEDESSWEVRDAARQGLIRFGETAAKAVKAAMPAMIGHSDEDVRLTAMELCGLFHVDDAYDTLLKTAVHDKSRTIRMFAARALEGVKPHEAIAALLKMANAASPTRKPRDYEVEAVRALGYVREKEAITGLLDLITTHFESEPLMREVEFALERLTGHRFGRKPDRWKEWLEKSTHPLHPMIAKFDRSKNRREAMAKGLYGLDATTERSVENGLRWLERQQHAIGFWDGNEKGFGGVVGCEPAYTGLSLLAFLGAGYHAEGGKYRETVRRASEFLAATQFYDGGFPVTGGGDDSWIFAYLISMGVWGVTESYALSGLDELREPAQWGIDYLVRVQTPGAGWRYGPRYLQSDTSCTSWVLMTLKAGALVDLDIAQRSLDGIDSWLERCSFDITGQEEIPEDLSTDYDYEVGSRRFFKAFTSYFELSGSETKPPQQTSMTAVGMVCRFFMGWKRSHPYMIGCANYLMDYLPTWMKGLEKGQSVAWYHYFWYYGTLAMYQMGGRYWRAWNDKIKRMYPEHQRLSPPELHGSWDPDTAILNGGRLFSTAMSILSLETYYRFSPLLGEG